MEDQPPCGGRGVDVLGQLPEPSTALLDGLHDVEKVTQRPWKAVVLRHHDHVTVAELIQHPVQLWSLAGRSADCVGEYPLGSCGAQSVKLGVKILVCGGNASVTDNHAGQGAKNLPKLQGFRWGFLTLSTAQFCVGGQTSPETTDIGASARKAEKGGSASHRKMILVHPIHAKGEVPFIVT